MATVTNTVRGPDGTPVRGAAVTVVLVSGVDIPGFVTGATIGGISRVTTKADGVWTVELLPNVGILPSNTYYRVTENRGWGKPAVYTVAVPDSGPGPYSVTDILVTAPVGPDPLFPVNPGSGEGGAVSSVDGRTGAVTLGDRYAALAHNHDGRYALFSHGHVVNDVSGLQTALDGKSGTAHAHAGLYAAFSHQHEQTDVLGLQASLDAKAPVAHTHPALLAGFVWSGTAYVPTLNAGHYTGPVDPGAVADGSVWDDTTSG